MHYNIHRRRLPAVDGSATEYNNSTFRGQRGSKRALICKKTTRIVLAKPNKRQAFPIPALILHGTEKKNDRIRDGRGPRDGRLTMSVDAGRIAAAGRGGRRAAEGRARPGQMGTGVCDCASTTARLDGDCARELCEVPGCSAPSGFVDPGRRTLSRLPVGHHHLWLVPAPNS